MTDEPGTEIVISGAPALTLFGTDDPRGVVEQAAIVARALKEVLVEQKLTNHIGTRDYVRVEGWTLLGSMIGVFPVEVYTRPIPEDWREREMRLPEGYEAKYEARTRSGELVGSANARCLRAESKWEGSDDYAIASMAQTRATSKALRTALGFIVVLAGFDATPAEEIPAGGVESERKPTTAAETGPEDPASDETFERARLILGADATAGDVAKAYRVEYEVEGPIYRTPQRDGTVVEEQKLADLCDALEALEADGSAEDEVVEGELVRST
jgi:hypothetical protein